jgi:hypothetical protein
MVGCNVGQSHLVLAVPEVHSSCLPRAPSALLMFQSRGGPPQEVSRHSGAWEMQNPASRIRVGCEGAFILLNSPQVPAADPKATCSLTRDWELDIHHAVSRLDPGTGKASRQL